jgi:NAD(P)-dependent dehydrogenase (short-subunit alcohol dehydrogenase family)
VVFIMSETMLISGANRGLGLGLATEAGRRGFDVIGTARVPEAASGGVTCLPLDVSSEASSTALAEALGDRVIDVVVCNAGVYPARGGMGDATYSEAEWAEGMMTNVAGPFFLVRALLPHLKRAKRPRIAIISSQMGSSERANGGSYIYRASKAAATNLASNLAMDLREDGIAVASYHPGWVRTDMGTAAAAISVEESASALLDRFEALSLAETGAFLNYDGEVMPF